MRESSIESGADLVPVHGGLAELVDRRVPLGERSGFVKEAERLPSIRVTRADLSTVYRISDGALSPMEGPMRAEVWNRVLDEQCVEVGGRRYAWAIPLSLPVTSEEASLLSSRGSGSSMNSNASIRTSRATSRRCSGRIASIIPAGARSRATRAINYSEARCARSRNPSISIMASTCSRRG